ncbi:MAG: APC family permease [Chthonomonadales bacterium]|nr:APC family permease [Chthonomonadales bacterium]
MPSIIRRLLLGRPLPTTHAVHERLPIILALPIFASDALSSVSYATEAILRQFHDYNVGHAQYGAAMALSLGIVGLILMVVVSYWQVIKAYARGGGSYLVARENLGLSLGLVAASALLVDYVLTVAVSVAEGVAATFSALHHVSPQFADLASHRLTVCLCVVAFLAVLNLRGVRESGVWVAIPSYSFIVLMFGIVALGLFRALVTGAPVESVAMPPNPNADVTLTPYLLIRGFASGCAALTGIEAVANGVQAFRAPEARNAQWTLGILGAILAALFTGITYLAVHFHIGPNETETVISQIARAAAGTEMPGGLLYYGVLGFTALILLLAANTAYAAFPRLAAILAEDGFLPRQLTALGDRLSLDNGIVALSLLAMGFLAVFGGETHALLPLYTVGVFIAFTTAQAGMVVHTLRSTRRDWPGLVINVLGGLVTFTVMVVVIRAKFVVPQPLFGTTWFYEGAWMALLLMAATVALFYGIARHYRGVAEQLARIPEDAEEPIRHTVIVLVPSRIHRGVLSALNYARTIDPNAIAVHVAFDAANEQALAGQWERYAGGTPLVVLDSPYRSLVRPVLQYLDETEHIRDDDVVTVVLPEFVPARWWQTFLHNATGWVLRLHLHYRRGIVITSVRYYLEE